MVVVEERKQKDQKEAKTILKMVDNLSEKF